MTIGITSAGATSSMRPSTGSASKSGADFTAIFEAFQAEAAKTPAERARDSVLAKHDLTEEDYRALPQAKRDAIDREIAEAVKKVTERDTGVPLSQRPLDLARLLG